MIRRTFEGLGELAEFLEKSAVIAEEAIAAVAAGSAALLHQRAVATFGDKTKLAPLAQSTQDERTALGYTPDEPLLRDGKLLRDSVEQAHSRTMAAIGSDEPIMAYHEYGYINARTGTSVPPRPVFQITLLESAEQIQAMLGEAVELTLGGEPRTLELLP